MFGYVQNGIVCGISDTPLQPLVGFTIIEADELKNGQPIVDGQPLAGWVCSKAEQAWVVSQLEWADMQLIYTRENSSRKQHEEADLLVYKEALRDYVKGGEVVGERPTLGGVV